MQIWLLHVIHDHDGTTHLGTLRDYLIPLYVCCHSDEFREYLHVVSEMQVTLLQLCRIGDGISQLMNLS